MLGALGGVTVVASLLLVRSYRWFPLVAWFLFFGTVLAVEFGAGVGL